MNYYSGKKLNDTLNQFKQEVINVFNHKNDEFENRFRERVNNINLGQIYLTFTNELRENILEYQNDELIMEYLYTCFGGFIGSYGVGSSITDKKIVRNQYNVGFLLKLKHAVEKYQEIINKWLELDVQLPGVKTTLLDRFEAIQKDIKNQNYKDDPVYFDIDGLIKEYQEKLYDENCHDERFFIVKLSEECDKIPAVALKIEFIRNRLVEFNQWKQQYEAKNDKPLLAALEKFIDMFYRDFEEQCTNKMAELASLLEPPTRHSSNLALAETSDTTSASYAWHASDTDLIELSIALLKIEAVRRTDGNQMTQKEMIGIFGELFDVEIKDAKGKLATAVGRKKSVTPFLDSLKTAFEVYSRERDENKPGQN